MALEENTFCDEGCEDSWKTDREYGVIYPRVFDPEVGRSFGWVEWHTAHGQCLYCSRLVTADDPEPQNQIAY